MANIYNSQLDAYSLYHQTQENAKPSSSIGPALPALGHAVSGSTGTAISNLCLYPLDLIITRLQVQRSLRKESNVPHSNEYQGVIDAALRIYTQEGLSGFYTGVLQDTGKSIADSFLFFLFYNYMREKRIVRKGGGSLPVFDELAVGALAGACSKFFTAPISNIVTRKQTAALLSTRSPSTVSNKPPSSPSVSHIARQIRAEKGFQGFWSGYSASLVLTLNPSITFFLYEVFKKALPRTRREDPGARITFLMAAVSKAIASLITYPFALAKARAQASPSPPVPTGTADTLKTEAQSASAEKVGKHAGRVAKRSTVFAAVLKIYREEGWKALYEGVGGEITKGFFSHGITMLVKEAVHKMVIQLYFFLLKLTNRASTGEVRDRAGEVAEKGYQAVADLGERVSVVGSNATEVARNSAQGVGNEVSDVAVRIGTEAGNLLGSARERLGGESGSEE